MKMVFGGNSRGFIVIVIACCIGLMVVVQPDRVSGLAFVGRSGIVKAVVTVEALQTRQDLGPVSSSSSSVMFDPNRSNKRKIKRGSDPIHDRC
ncbi:hypothetical protein Gohar_019576 [Gossypium harknessii]|uniref:Uncharacterized protein n=3 Tax=Gossypium TaxID=3633 RepID=A0A7J9IDP0_9ROSI|nr:hypothetical protein [Gossypium harknessii]TYH99038.1 hypothetical protein ES332_A11G039300v1 [Gossypium tomentosum]